MPKMSGGRFIAETAHGYGITHVFFMPFIAPRALMEMEKLGIKRIMTHGEKAAAYMADAYARVKRGPSLCLAQSVGALNLAAGLQDAYLACSPVIALTGRENQINQHRHAYQEVNHANPFAAVTKYEALVNSLEQLPLYLRQAFREATSGTPGPVHLDLEGIAGQVIAEGEAECERRWSINHADGQEILTISRLDRPTCHLMLDADGVWRGRWLEHERMPVELISIESMNGGAAR